MKTLGVIAGPTASGKTALAIRLALHYRTEIISSDSRQFYRKMNIGTAKPLTEELELVKHHFINSLDIADKYNVGRFETDAIEKIESLFINHEKIIMTGGSGLYIDAVCEGIDELPESDSAERERLTHLYKSEGIEALQKRLKEADPEYFSEVDKNNPHRLMRALEIIATSGRKYSSLRNNPKKDRSFRVKKIGLLIDRDVLYENINNRVDKMIKLGLVDEVESLLPFRNQNSMQSVGYRELVDYFDKKISLQQAIDLIKQNTRNYAKRQMTWFRRDPQLRWYAPDEFEKIVGYIEEEK